MDSLSQTVPHSDVTGDGPPFTPRLRIYSANHALSAPVCEGFIRAVRQATRDTDAEYPGFDGREHTQREAQAVPAKRARLAEDQARIAGQDRAVAWLWAQTGSLPYNANLKELRPGSSGRSEVRVLFVFDPWRSAILLVAGDKAGNWNKWYARMIPRAEQLYEIYLKERAAEEGSQ
jgi:hypothetical protein